MVYMFFLFKQQLNRLINFINFKKQNIFIEKNMDINGLLFVKNEGIIKVGNIFHVNSGRAYNPLGNDIVKLVTKKNAELIIGDDVGISNCTIVSTNSIKIGDKVAIGGGVCIIDSDFYSIHLTERFSGANIVSKPVIIHNGVFIGAYSKILKGVTIGENSVIVLGSIVTSNISPNEIWGGCPAQFIKKVEL